MRWDVILVTANATLSGLTTLTIPAAGMVGVVGHAVPMTIIPHRCQPPVSVVRSVGAVHP